MALIKTDPKIAAKHNDKKGFKFFFYKKRKKQKKKKKNVNFKPSWELFCSSSLGVTTP